MAKMHGWFITGTSTEVGKTYVAAKIVRELSAAGVRVGVYKPVASGCRQEGNSLLADDAQRLWEAAGRPRSLLDVCPQLFAAPLAPPAAASAVGQAVDDNLLRQGIERWADSEWIVVEGAGGFLSPLSEQSLNADLAVDLGMPVVIVAANALGAINHTLLTFEACRARGLCVAAVVLNDASPDCQDISRDGNQPQLERWLAGQAGPVIRLRNCAANWDPAIDWQQLR